MRTIPHIVAEIKTLIAELESHTGILPSEENFQFSCENTITLGDLGGSQPAILISDYEMMTGDITLDFSYSDPPTTSKF